MGIEDEHELDEWRCVRNGKEVLGFKCAVE